MKRWKASGDRPTTPLQKGWFASLTCNVVSLYLAQVKVDRVRPTKDEPVRQPRVRVRFAWKDLSLLKS